MTRCSSQEVQGSGSGRGGGGQQESRAEAAPTAQPRGTIQTRAVGVGGYGRNSMGCFRETFTGLRSGLRET